MSSILRVDCDFVDDARFVDLLYMCGPDSARNILKLWRVLDQQGGEFRVHKNEIRACAILMGISSEKLTNLLLSGVETGFFKEQGDEILVSGYVQNNINKTKANIKRLNIVSRYMPEAYRVLTSSGIKSISKDDFERLKQADDKVAMANKIVTNKG